MVKQKFAPDYVKQELANSYAAGQLTDGLTDVIIYIIRGRMHHFHAMYTHQEDVIQECFLHILKKFHGRKIEVSDGAFSYLTTCVVNKFKKLYHKQPFWRPF